jgi:hypothetical protein
LACSRFEYFIAFDPHQTLQFNDHSNRSVFSQASRPINRFLMFWRPYEVAPQRIEIAGKDLGC